MFYAVLAIFQLYNGCLVRDFNKQYYKSLGINIYKELKKAVTIYRVVESRCNHIGPTHCLIEDLDITLAHAYLVRLRTLN